MRFELIRYAAESTNWSIDFALRRLGHYTPTGDWRRTYLLEYDGVGTGGKRREVLSFGHPQEAINWVRDHAPAGSSVEWEGSSY